MYTISKNGQLCVWDCSLDLDALVPETEEKSVECKANCDAEDDIVSKENGKCWETFLFFFLCRMQFHNIFKF